MTTITIEQLDAKLSELQSMVAKFKAQKQPEPCPLEEGKHVFVHKIGNRLMKATYGGLAADVSVEKAKCTDGEWECVVIRIGYGDKESALNLARDIVGGKSD